MSIIVWKGRPTERTVVHASFLVGPCAALANPFHATYIEKRMIFHFKTHRQSADRAEVPLRPCVTVTQALVLQLGRRLLACLLVLLLQLGRSLLACLLVLLAMCPLAVHAAVFDEAASRAVLQLDGAALALAAFGAHNASRVDWDTTHGAGITEMLP